MFLTINNIKKSFGSGDSRIEVLKGINLSMEQGEFCVLLGPSGSGKSTLLNIIGGIDAADEGDICIEGYHDPVYSGEWEMTAQRHALRYLKWCRGGDFVPNPWEN